MPSVDPRTPSADRPKGSTAAEPSGSPIEALIVGGNDETRLLLRGLLRLHRYRVRSESPRAAGLEPSGGLVQHRVLILVTEGEIADWPQEVALARDRQPGLQTLLLVPTTTPGLEARARAAGVKGLLQRPFAIRDLIASVEAVGRGIERYPDAAPQS